MKTTLQGKIWFEFEQYNATIEPLYLSGNGKTQREALDNLILGYSELCNRVSCRVVENNDSSFSLEFSEEKELLEKIIQVLMGSRNSQDIKIESFDDYLKYFKNL